LLVARLSSVLINVGIVWLAFLTFGELLPTRRDLSMLAAALIVLMPQHTFVNSAVGEGPLAEMMSCLVIYGWVRLFGGRSGIWPVAGIVLGTICGMASKNTAVFLVPLDVGLALWWLWRRARWRWTWRTILGLCVTVVLLALGLWVWRHTDLGRRAYHVAQALPAFSDWAWTDLRGMTFGEALLVTYDSFWVNFGWMSLPLSPRWYGAIAGISALAVCGWCVRRRQETPTWAVGLMLAALLSAVLIYLWVGLLSRPGAYYQFQGRYLYPAVFAFVFFLVGGIDRFFSVSSRKVAELVFLSFFLLLDTWAVCGYVLPTFYG
jgi:hypothetical protein